MTTAIITTNGNAYVKYLCNKRYLAGFIDGKSGTGELYIILTKGVLSTLGIDQIQQLMGPSNSYASFSFKSNHALSYVLLPLLKETVLHVNGDKMNSLPFNYNSRHKIVAQMAVDDRKKSKRDAIYYIRISLVTEC